MSRSRKKRANEIKNKNEERDLPIHPDGFQHNNIILLY